MPKGMPSKSDAIRAALTANPERPVAEIVRELRVTPSLVYNVKANMKNEAKTKAKPGRKPGRKPAAKPDRKVSAPEAAHAALDSAFEFVTKVGGLLHAEQLLAKLRSIKERL